MKSSLFLVASGAALAMAGPIRAPLEKRVMETDWVYEIVTVTVTAGQEAAAEATAAIFMQPETTKAAAKTTTKHGHKHRTSSAPAVVTTTTTLVSSTAEPTTIAETTIVVEPTTSAAPVTTAKPVTTEEPATTTVAAPATTSASSSLDDYATSVLDQHNVHRLNHSSPALEWDSELAQWAANTASTCVFAHDMDQGSGGYGQNIASWGSSADIADMAIDAGSGAVTNQWYNSEMENWAYYGDDNPPDSAPLDDWGHFTQVVWKSSTKVGCATQSCAAGTLFSFASFFTVCNYDPAGNFGGEYGDNVLEPLGKAMSVV